MRLARFRVIKAGEAGSATLKMTYDPIKVPGKPVESSAVYTCTTAFVTADPPATRDPATMSRVRENVPSPQLSLLF